MLKLQIEVSDNLNLIKFQYPIVQSLNVRKINEVQMYILMNHLQKIVKSLYQLYFSGFRTILLIHFKEISDVLDKIFHHMLVFINGL